MTNDVKFPDDPFKCVEYVSNFENKATTWAVRNLANFIQSRQYISGIPSFKILTENLATVHRGLAFNYNSPYFEAFNEIIGRMVSSGLPNYWFNAKYLKDFDPRVPDIGPQVLNLGHLQIGFFACLVLFIIGFLIFLGEKAFGGR